MSVSLFEAYALRGKFREPRIEDRELVRGDVRKCDSHSHPRLNVNNFAGTLENALVARNAHLERGAFRQRDQNIDVTPFTAELGDAAWNASIANRLAQLNSRYETESRHLPLVGIWTARLVRWRV